MDKNDEFNKFWNKKIEFINTVSLNYNLTKTSFSTFDNIEYYDLYFTSFDGAKIYAKYLKNKKIRKNIPKNKKIPVLFYFHGYPASSRNWLEKTAYCSLGYDIIAMDFRGQGGLSEDIGGVKGATAFGHIIAGIDDDISNMIYVKNILDMCLLVKIVQTFPDIDRYNLNSFGASQGGAFSLICAALNKDIKKCISLYPFLSDFKKIYDLDKDIGAYEELRLYSRWFNVDGKLDSNLFNKLSFIDSKNFAPKISAKVLFGISALDSDCPVETQYALFNNISSEKKLCLYKKYSHEDIPPFGNEVLSFLLEQ
ncbi:alpha/beta fold hydrolase [Gemella cuniculi]|uniref:alpha/beta fold hydrolase n=1 Tax=Gemella cuniculi TaxID=150240 RepID=UPI00040EBA58|nr:alpha/beta fold hydrolase [Gemella cuniculi]